MATYQDEFYSAGSDLGRREPTDQRFEVITSQHHDEYFGRFTNVDVWMDDGWLVTASLDNGSRVHARKGQQCKKVNIDNQQVFRVYNAPENCHDTYSY